MKLIFLIFLFLGLLKAQGQSTDLYSYQRSTAFANHLFKTKQYALAATEYERLLFLAPTADSLQTRLLLSYQLGGNNAFGIRRAEVLYPQRSRMPQPVAFQYTRMLLQEKAYTRADTFLTLTTSLPLDDRLLLQATSQAYRHDWRNTQTYLKRVNPEARPIIGEFKTIVAAAQQQPYKSPGLAAGLSAIVPGAGKVYTRDWKDGIIAFVMTGTSAWQGYRSFKQAGSGSVRGWIFTSIGTGFYLGNIFGSHKSARLYNQKLHRESIRKIETLFSTPL